MTLHLTVLDVPRPRTRGDCVDGPRPCPWAGCRHHLLLDVDKHGVISARAEEPDELEDTCSLDVAERGVHRLEDIGKLLDLTLPRVRQIVDDVTRRLGVDRPGQIDLRELTTGWAHGTQYEVGADDIGEQDDLAERVDRAYRKIVRGEILTPSAKQRDREDPK